MHTVSTPSLSTLNLVCVHVAENVNQRPLEVTLFGGSQNSVQHRLVFNIYRRVVPYGCEGN